MRAGLHAWNLVEACSNEHSIWPTRAVKDLLSTSISVDSAGVRRYSVPPGQLAWELRCHVPG